MNELIEVVEIAGIALACSLGGASLAIAVLGRKASANRARRVARHEASHHMSWYRNAVEIRLARIEGDNRAHHSAMNIHGLMEGSRIVPDRSGRPRLRLADDTTSEQDGAA